MFNAKDVNLSAYIHKGILHKNIITISTYIDIDQFRTWIMQNHPDDIMMMRQYWEEFKDYVKSLVEYGYYFDNIPKLDKIVNIDNIVETYASQHDLNICSSGIINNFNSPNSSIIAFDISAETYMAGTDPDEILNMATAVRNELSSAERQASSNNIVNDITSLTNNNSSNNNSSNNTSSDDSISDNTDDNTNDNNTDNNADDISITRPLDKHINVEETLQNAENRIKSAEELEQEETDRMMDMYNQSNIIQGRIGDKVMFDNLRALSDLDYIAQLSLPIKVTQHKLQRGIASLKLALTKKMFTTIYELQRSNSDEAWDELVNNISDDPDKFINWLNEDENISIYANEQNWKIDKIRPHIYDVDLKQSKTIIRFWIDLYIEV